MSNKYINLPELLEYLKQSGVSVTETRDTSLTSPVDQTGNEEENKRQSRLARRVKLTDEELDIALEKLITRWPRVEKRWTDPVMTGKELCSFSFIPSSGATPDKDGLYGLLKIRGTFSNETDQDANAESILADVDSFHAIHHGFTGHPLPLVKDNDDRYCLSVENVSLREKIKGEMSKNAQEHHREQKKFVEEVEEKTRQTREKEEAALRGEIDEEERYITLRVKRANLIFTLYQMLAGMKRYKDTLLQTIDVLSEMDEKNPTFQNTFLAKYKHAADEVGLPEDKNHIIRYMVGPIPFDINLIPDDVDVFKTDQPLIIPMDISNLDYQKIASDMTAKANSKDKVEENKE